MADILVTGSNKGIGLALCRQLSERGDRVVAVCRHSSEELRRLPVEVIPGIELTSEESVDRLAEELRGRPLQGLILNAGVYESSSLGSLHFGHMLHEYDVNALGPLRVIQALMSNLTEGTRIALITSRVGSMADNGSGGIYGYRMAKAALNMAGVCLAHDLRPRGVAVVLLHPGRVDTGMLRVAAGHGEDQPPPPGSVSPGEAAAGLLARFDELTLAGSGRFLHRTGEELPW